MARNKKSETPHYEMLYIVSNKYSEEEVVPIVEKVNKTIANAGGKVTYEEIWGKKKLAYPIQHFNHGYYQLVEFDITGEGVAKIDKEMRMSSEIIRHMVVAVEHKTKEEIKKEKEEKKKMIEKDKEEKKQEKEEEKKQKEEKQKLKEEKEVKRKKVDLKDLDEKLDKILETDDLL